ncbi:MAG: alpha/beta hydrolase [Flavisolibacter sp.]
MDHGPSSSPMHTKNIITAGSPLEANSKVLIMLHGRGGSAEDILSLAKHLYVDGFTLLAPQATGNSWYPQSFMASPELNEPWLTSALDMLKVITDELKQQGISSDQIYFAGFSQGACLTLEFITRNAARYGGAAAFTGGLIGDRIYLHQYKGDFQGTPVFIGTSDPDPHVPVERVYASANILKDMHADVLEKVYAHMGHTINQDEINLANQHVFSQKKLT